jgi:hypothetical protein
MEAKIRGAFESVGSFFTGGDHIPWCDRDIITVSTIVGFPEFCYCHFGLENFVKVVNFKICRLRFHALHMLDCLIMLYFKKFLVFLILL